MRQKIYIRRAIDENFQVIDKGHQTTHSDTISKKGKANLKTHPGSS